MEGKVIKVSGPLIVAENMADVNMYDVVKVSDKKLIGERLPDVLGAVELIVSDDIDKAMNLYN